jgi:methylmalonyl-CoA/ethylmalonyl-CoA epimerase
MKFDHIGIAVENMEEGRRLLAAMFEIERWTEVFEDAGLGVFVQFGKGASGPCYELIAPLGPSSPVSSALKSGRNILNHVAYLVENLDTAASALQEDGCFPVVKPKHAVAYGGNLVQFFQSPLRFLIELIEAPEHRHIFLIDAKRQV